jgi:type IV pilus assembly protein PilO
MASKLSLNLDVAELKNQLAGQFSNLDPKNPSAWPALPRYGLLLAVVTMVFAMLWFSWLREYQLESETEQQTELKLREEFNLKMVKAANLAPLKKQREQVLQFVTQLEKQLPSKAEMDALLSDINQAGLGRSLQFDLFRPGLVNVKEYYAELPIALRVTGRYHDMGAFAADIANLSRIVTLNNLTIVPGKDATLVMDATAKTFRYLDPEEVMSQRKATAPKGAKK